ncbi:unnamed protein product [Fraxinus pennsylvanica]|uniref:TORTIFOLIA1/SINE1-2 N-terminal domain-containing protein n=1 Tax=Fraxinus pennsylvanica TaxID=56036 RepID=A0AAD2DIR8_9LAMI|nr:unnamed protein product [Fraxinus pennsylvanica]
MSKLLSAIVRRLRDPDSSVRSACVSASLSLSSRLTSSSFASITKPFLEFLFREHDSNTRAALCLVSIIEGSQSLDSGSLKRLLLRFWIQSVEKSCPNSISHEHIEEMGFGQ